MSENQLKYKSNYRIKFEERLLMDQEYFAWFAKAFMNPPEQIAAPGLYEGFLEWSWRNRDAVEKDEEGKKC